tara:strand:- start:1 stop:468 length:468 start_codon:yes stop_codon:yes gene_type:complete
MKKLIFLATVLLSINAQALRDCPSDTSARWHNCFGTYTWPDGDKYVGGFKDDNIHGQGTYTWPDGNKYVGEYKDGKRNGQGTLTWPDGDKYVGGFKDDNYHGQGTYTFANGTVERGYYMNDEYVPDLCEDMGLTKGTEAFGNCVLKLIDEVNEGG